MTRCVSLGASCKVYWILMLVKTRLKGHFYLINFPLLDDQSHLSSLFSLFPSFFHLSPFALSHGWVILHLLDFELAEEQLSTYWNLFPNYGFICLCTTLIQNPNRGTGVIISFALIFSIFFSFSFWRESRKSTNQTKCFMKKIKMENSNPIANSLQGNEKIV